MSVYVSGTLAALGAGPFATHDAQVGLDGWRSVADHTARNAIVTGTPLRCRQGMAVYTASDGFVWILNTSTPAGTDGDWTQLAAGGSGSGTVTSVSFTGDGTVFTASAGTPVTTSGTLTPSLITQTAHYVLAGPTSAGPTAPTFRVLAGADLPSTGLTITQWGGAIGSGSIIAGTATFNLNTDNRWALTLDHTQTVTLALSGGSVGQQFTLALSQDSTGSCAVTWFAGITWAGGSVPTLTTTASKGDLFTFLCVGTGSYWGMIAGQNF